MKTKENWLSPLNKVLLVEAFKKRQTSVKLRDGRVFNIRYDTPQSEKAITVSRRGVVWISPVKEMVPCGYFSLDKILSDPENWIYESDVPDKTPAGIYYDMLSDFIRSSKLGVIVDEEWPELARRQPATLASGFRTAIELKGKAAHNLKVMTRGGRVYLVKVKDDE